MKQNLCLLALAAVLAVVALQLRRKETRFLSNGHSPHMDMMMNNMKACEEERGVKVSEEDIEFLKKHACPESESFQCLLECATNKTNLVSKDGQPDYNAFEEEVNKSSAPEDKKLDILSKAKTCFTNYDPSNGKCPLGTMVCNCFMEEKPE